MNGPNKLEYYITIGRKAFQWNDGGDVLSRTGSGQKIFFDEI